jgi:hypothetical protein
VASTLRLPANFLVGIGRYFLVFTIPIPKEILIGTFWYHFFGGNPFFPQKGGTGPLFEEKRGHRPPFRYSQPPFCGSSHQTSNTNQNTNCPHPNQGTFVSPTHVTTSYGTWGGAIGTRQNNGLPLCKNLKLTWRNHRLPSPTRINSILHP